MARRASDGQALASVRSEATRRAIADAAIPLFVRDGYEQTSMAQVADAVGVSRRTVYRYFDTKEDLVFDYPRRWLHSLEEVVEDRAPEEPTRTVLRRGLIRVAEVVESDAANVLAAFSILDASPMLRARHGRSDAQWVERYVALMLEDLVGDARTEASASSAAMFQASVAAMAIVAGQNAVMVAWATSYPTAQAAELMAAMLEQLDGVWPAASR